MFREQNHSLFIMAITTIHIISKTISAVLYVVLNDLISYFILVFLYYRNEDIIQNLDLRGSNFILAECNCQIDLIKV